MPSIKPSKRRRALFLISLFIIAIALVCMSVYTVNLKKFSTGTLITDDTATTSTALARFSKRIKARYVRNIPVSTTTPTAVVPATTTSVVSTPPPVVTNPTITTSVVAPPVTTTQSETSLNYTFGLSVGNRFVDLSSSDLNAYLDDMVAHGVGWLRFDMSWYDVQRNNNSTYDWAPLDRVVAAVNAHHMKMLPILLATPAWARITSCSYNNEFCAPKDPAQFATFAGEAVKRYAPQGIHQWEIWNEPNMGNYWQPKGNVVGYSDLLKATAVAIRKQDPQAIIVTGGLGPADTKGEDISPLDFLDQLYKSGAKSSFDAVGSHPYSFPVTASYTASWSAWQQMANTTRSLRSIMIANGDTAKQIWSTEYGASTGGPGLLATTDNYQLDGGSDHVSEDLQKMMLTEAITAHAVQPWAGPLFWYSYIDIGTSQRDNENFFGLRRFDGTSKPAYSILRSLLIQ